MQIIESLNCTISREICSSQSELPSVPSILTQHPAYAQNPQKKVFTSSFLFQAAHSIFETIWFLESSSVY